MVGTLRGEIKTLPPDNSLFISPGAADQDDDDDDDTAMKSDDEGVCSQHLLLCWRLECELRALYVDTSYAFDCFFWALRSCNGLRYALVQDVSPCSLCTL